MKSLFNLEKKNFSNEIKVHRDIDDNDIAVIGISVRLPMAENLEEFREVLKNKIDCIREVSDRRKGIAEEYLRYKNQDENIEFAKGAFLEDIDKFDYSFFKITPMEARLMNPLHRALLESTYSAIDDAGYANDSIKGSKTGVFIGNIDIDSYKYTQMILETENKTNIDLSAIGNLNSMIPSRISYFLDLKGPSMLIDTACSSSLVAVHEACRAIINKDCDTAIVGSGRVNIMPVNDGIRIGMESPSGFVKAFDNNADGTNIGEGVISIFLKPLKKAVEDKDNIYCVIKGSAVNQDGTTMGITAPSAEAQSKVISSAWDAAKINPENIEYFEAHGTATSLGDVIELNGIKKAFEKYTARKQFCAIGSLKSNIGHLYNASGLASIAKCIIQLRYKELLPTTNFNNPNKKVNFTELPVYINDKYSRWESTCKARTCSVSSFGFSGTNCHMVLQEYKDNDYVNEESTFNILSLSAKSDESLLDTVNEYKKFISYHKDDLQLKSMCYTANVFKAKYDKRLCIIFKTREELSEGLEKAAEAENIDKLIYVNENIENNEIKNLVCRAEEFAQGKDVDWESLYSGSNVRKTSIPTYRFNKKNCWIKIDNKNKKTDSKIFYDTKWVKEELAINNNILREEKILLIRDSSSDMNELAQLLRNYKFEIYELSADDIDELRYKLNEEEVGKSILSCNRIIYSLTSLKKKVSNFTELKERQYRSFYGLLELIQWLDRNALNYDIEIEILTANAERICDEDSIPENSIAIGLGKVIEIEYPNYKCKVIDFDGNTSKELIINEMFSDNQHYIAGYRNNTRYIKELNYIDVQNKDSEEVFPKENNTYIVTGGLGALGKLSCEYLSDNINSNIVILGRRVLESEQFEALEIYKKLREKGNNIVYYSVDIGNYQELKDTISEIKAKYKNISGVVHCAGCGTSGLIKSKTFEQVEKVLAPKVYGTWNLLNLLSDQSMDFFIMFSSGLTVIGEYGQGDYVAANTYLDELCRVKFKNIKRVLTINWPAFNDAGIGEKFKYENKIFKSVNTGEFNDIFEKIFKSSNSRVIVGEINDDVSYESISQKLRMKLSMDMINDMNKSIPDMKKAHDTVQIKTERKYDTAHDNLEKIQENIKDICNEILGFEDIDVQANLLEIGVDSIIFAKVHEKINEIYPKAISISQMFMYPSVQALSQYIYDKFNIENSSDIKPKEIIEEKDLTDDLSKLLDMTEDQTLSVDDIINKIEEL